MAVLNFNAASVPPQEGFGAVPSGWYNVMIHESELKPTKAGDGNYLYIVMKILDGQYVGRMIFQRLNLENKNPVAVNIAYAELSAIGHVTGVLQINDSAQLHGIPFQVKVVFKDSPEHGEQNEVKGYRDRTGRDAKDCAGGAAPAAAPVAPAAPAAPPPPPVAPVAAVPTRPTDPSHIAPNPAGGELWWNGTEWAPAPVAAAAATPPPPPAAPAAPAAPTPPPSPAAPAAGPTPPWVKPS